MFDPKLVGDVSTVQKLIPNLTSNGNNWIHGSLGKFKICAKVFSESSTFGIKNGRISKLQVCNSAQEGWGFDACYINYDRGWDIRPKDAPEREFLNQLLEAFGDPPLDGDDYLYYELRGYGTKEDFENQNFDYLGALDTKNDAISEANEYIKGGEHWEPYEVVKVLCSDPEADDDIVIRVVGTEKTA